jgi:hypothetical protein
MKKIVPKGLTALFIVFLLGTLLASCGPIFDVGDVDGNGDDDGGNPNPPPPPQSGYTAVKAADWTELADYLQSTDTSYAITLETENNNIYLQRSISIVKPMKIIGSSGDAYIIHAVNRAGGNAYYCLDLQANLELEYCSFIGYSGTSSAVSDIAAGSPPLNIRVGRTLTLTGTDSVLELRGVGSGTAIRAGSQVILTDGANIVDESGDLLFKSGVEKLIISGKIALGKKLTVGSGGILQIENGGELRVGPGATLTLNNDLKELKLGGNIVIDRTTDNSVGAIALPEGIDSLLAKITGNGSLSIENGIPETTTTPFGYGANTVIKLSSDGISLGKRVSSGLGGVINTTGGITIPNEKKLLVGAGVDFSINKTLILAGGTLNVAGNVNVTSGGQITLNAVDNFNAIPKGTVLIESSGIITVDGGGMFTDKSVTWDDGNKTIAFPSYGSGSLIFKNSSTSGVLALANKNLVSNATGSGLLVLSQGVTTSFTIKNGPAYTLSGNATLTVPGADFALTGAFTVSGGAELTVSGYDLTVRSPNTLVGTNTTTGSPKLNVNGVKVFIYFAGDEKPTPADGINSARVWTEKNGDWGWNTQTP